MILSGEPNYSFGLIVDIVVFEVDNYFIICEVLNTDQWSRNWGGRGGPLAPPILQEGGPSPPPIINLKYCP